MRRVSRVMRMEEVYTCVGLPACAPPRGIAGFFAGERCAGGDSPPYRDTSREEWPQRRGGLQFGKGLDMRPFTTELSEPEGEDELAGRQAVPPDLFNRRKPAQRTRKRAKRSRANNMAKRGMHQRRNKRVAW
jgi:hypothetical protein